ncbi:MAG: trehalose-phosphatase [Casimicrobiaceae bacterium]
MTYALSVDGLARIHKMVDSSTLLAFDIDGTLAPIVSQPWAARISPEVRTLLMKLNASQLVAIVTGRGVADARKMLGFEPRYVIGNHGAEGIPRQASSTAAFARICEGWASTIAASGPAWPPAPGVLLENKQYSLAIHYRHVANADGTRADIERLVLRLSPLPTIVHGKFVINLLPPGAPHKGDALRALLADSGAPYALYVGDDVTDEDVYALGLPNVLSICVAPAEFSKADLHLVAQDEILTLLEEIDAMISGTFLLLKPVTP